VARIHKSRQEFWIPTLEGNACRDAENERTLRALGWDLLVAWECQTVPTRRRELAERLCRFLSEENATEPLS